MRHYSTRSLFITALVVFAAAFGLYEYGVSKNLQTELGRVQSQVANLTSAPASSSTPTDSITATVARATPAVVSVVISEDVPQYGLAPGFGRRMRSFGLPMYQQTGTSREEVGAGSGFFVSPDGYIVTNKHVTSDPNGIYSVVLSDGSSHDAEVVYTDPIADIALLKIAGSGYPTIPLGNSSSVALGESVLAIGNALGEYSNSVSQGIISGLNRSVEAMDSFGGTESLSSVMQTDAAINPGDSGGPLLDLSGKVVGVNVATVEGSQNIAFAIPIDMVKSIIQNHL